MNRSGFPSDMRRDAQKYGHLLNALKHTTQAIRALEENGSQGIEDVLETLLPGLAKALNAEKTFVAKQQSNADGTRTWVKLIAVHPTKDLVGHELATSELLQSLIQSGKPRVIDLPGSEPHQVILGLELFQATSAILVRMQTIDQVYIVGVCNKRDPDAGPFVAGDRMALDGILAMLAVGIRTAERRQREHKAIQTISEAATHGNPAEVWRVIAQQAAELTKASYATLVTVDKKRARLEAVGTWYMEPAQWQPQGWFLPLDDSSMNGHVALTQQKHYASAIRQEPHYKAVATILDLDIKAAFCVPLVVGDETIGTLYIASASSDGISREDQEFIEQLTPHAAIALHNAQLLMDMQKHLKLDEAVIRIQQAISDIFTEQPLVHQIREVLEPFVDVNGFFFATYNEKTQWIRLPAAYDHGQRVEPAQAVSKRYSACRLGERRGLIEYVLRSEEPLLVEDFTTWAHRNEIEAYIRDDCRCCLVVPMRKDDKIIGVIGLRGYEATGVYDQDDLELLKKIAPHIAIVVANAQIYEQRLKELEAVSSFQRRISELDISESDAQDTDIDLEGREIDKIYLEAHRALQGIDMETDNMFITLYDEETDKLEFPLVYVRGERMRNEENVAESAYRTRQLGERSDLVDWIIRKRQLIRFSSRSELEIFTEQHQLKIPHLSRSWLGSPMMCNGKLIGVISLRDLDRENAFSETHEKLLQTIAQQAAIAIQNARLYESLRNRVSQLGALFKAGNAVINKAGQAISEAGLESTAVLQAILEQATQATGAFFGTLQVVEGSHLKFVAAWPVEQKEQLEQPQRMMPMDGRGITARAVQQNHAQLIVDVRQDPDFVDATGGRTRSELAVVIRRSGEGKRQPLGVLNVEHETIGGLSDEDKQLLIALSNLALIAMQSAEQAEQFSRTNAIAVMGAWGANIVHDMDRETANIRLAIETLRAQTDLPREKLLERLHEIDTYAKNLIMPVLPEQPLLPGQSMELKNPPILDGVIRSEAEKLRRDHAMVNFILQTRCADIRTGMHEQWLRQVIRNLVKNSIRANPGLPRRLEVVIGTEVQATMTEIWVQDNGRGVRPEIEKLLFNRPIPHTAERSEERSGRGLVWVRHIVELHGGKVWLKQNRLEEGACFAFSIPRA
ncbi:MAG: GAF domain-containing protein [Chloroflexi bacterium]|nr:GAF domain-containing protein [Chloroflexota bacterium]